MQSDVVSRPPSSPSRIVERLAVALGIALLPAMLLLAGDFGVTWDEHVRQANGEHLWLRYQGQREAPPSSDEVYGGLFDLSAVALQHVVPRDHYYVRHLMNAFFGWLGIVGCGVLGWRIGGAPTALLAAVLLALSPRYFGHSMNNPKDLPFATAATWALVATSYLPRTYPYLRARHVLAVGTVVGAALAIRVGGLLFVGYVALWILTAIIARHDWRPWHLGRCALGLAAILGLAVIVAMPVWPVLWEKPLTGVFEAAEKVSRYPWDGYVLFAGREVPGTRLPWTYAPVWLLATTPPVILAGALLSVVVPGGVCLMTRRRARADPAVSLRRNERRDGDTALLIGFWFAVLFPIAYVILRRSTLYDGLRHLLFIVPPFTALAAAGWTMALARARSGLKVGLYVIIALGLMEPWLFQLRNHPNQVVYFQPLVGGPAAAYARFDLDYWGNCLFQAVQHAGRLGRAAGRPVVISGARWRIMQLDARRVPQVLVTRPDRRQHDLRVTLLRGPRRWLLDVRERPDILWQVTTADGAPLCMVTPGPRFDDLRARLERAGVLPALLPGAAK